MFLFSVVLCLQKELSSLVSFVTLKSRREKVREGGGWGGDGRAPLPLAPPALRICT